MSRIERLINLTAALLSAERPLTSEDLRERISGYPDDKASFRRQFERDKDALRELGLPLEVISERRGREEVTAYRVNPEEYFVRDPGLEPDELSALHLAAKLVEVEGLDPQSALWKLNAAARAERSRKPSMARALTIESSVDPIATATLPADERLTEMFGIIASGSSVSFGYRGEQRLVQPRRLSFSRAHWYLAAFDVERQADRSFRLDRMEGALTTGPPSPLPATLRANSYAFSRPWELGDEGTEQDVVLRVDAAQAPWAVRHIGRGAVRQTNTDGSVDFALAVRNVDAFRTFALGFLDHAEVLSPESVRAHIVSWLQNLQTNSAAQS
jgi:proteasome accessory factor B